ncbi:hypothetical protein [Streptomyces sp. CB03911]|uniref:hypothetical protein n=1 Tax=Streptomyces sp. CB03911 TaxID=1804758 RepID=UPI00093F08FF|nr:hypothetical protein [Streptomyces sp. CB03911]OKI25061.1 hypothetical protein A6A07_31160 [Streptomyces sp. CB03911]
MSKTAPLLAAAFATVVLTVAAASVAAPVSAAPKPTGIGWDTTSARTTTATMTSNGIGWD